MAKSELLRKIAGSDRGQSSTVSLKNEVQELVDLLARLSPTDLRDSSVLLVGDWNLISTGFISTVTPLLSLRNYISLFFLMIRSSSILILFAS